MNLCTLLASTAARASLAVGLALSLFASSATAQATKAPKAAPPVATATLDVCSNEANGKWRYSGVVTVFGAQAGGVIVDNRVQNQTSRAGYVDVLGAKSAKLDAVARDGETVAVPFAFEAAPLTLGVMRNAATVQVFGQSGDPTVRTLFAQSEMVTADAVCGCAPQGCVRTQGYWGNKPGVVWPYNRNALFYASGRTWQQILDTPPRGSAYLILAHQYIAAMLNRGAGASAPSSVQSVIYAARTWFESGKTPASCGPGDCPLQKTWAGTLDMYNNGQYPGAPKHCD